MGELESQLSREADIDSQSLTLPLLGRFGSWFGPLGVSGHAWQMGCARYLHDGGRGPLS